MIGELNDQDYVACDTCPNCRHLKSRLSQLKSYMRGREAEWQKRLYGADADSYAKARRASIGLAEELSNLRPLADKASSYENKIAVAFYEVCRVALTDNLFRRMRTRAEEKIREAGHKP